MAKKKTEATTAETNSGKEKIDVQAATLVGNIRDEILGLFKSHGEWKKLKEAQQRDIAAGAEAIAKEIVRKSAEIIAGRGFKAIHGTLAQITVKDGLKMVVTARWSKLDANLWIIRAEALP